MLPQVLSVIPSARRLTESLRDIGYDLPAAIADVVDNSLDADASLVDVTIAFEGGDSWIRIADNGLGMDVKSLNEGMRYGSNREYEQTQLGKFGLGLKTASLSQCRQLTVATRSNSERRELEIRRWDIDHVADTNNWELFRLRPSECRDGMLVPLFNHTGTVVLWEKLDRILTNRYKVPEGLAAEHGLLALCRDVEEYLAMVFHRFLSGESKRRRKFSISINGNAVRPWDPFCRSEPATKKLETQVLPLDNGKRGDRITVQPYILPAQFQFSTPRAHAAASGPKKWNRQQGFYIYRGDRMIQTGGWNRLRTIDEHSKLARIAVEIPRSADASFEINVSKMRVSFPADVRDAMAAIASGVVAKAKAAYDGRPDVPKSPRHRPNGRVPPGGSIQQLVPIADVEAILGRELRDQPTLHSRILAEVRAIRSTKQHDRQPVDSKG